MIVRLPDPTSIAGLPCHVCSRPYEPGDVVIEDDYPLRHANCDRRDEMINDGWVADS